VKVKLRFDVLVFNPTKIPKPQHAYQSGQTEHYTKRDERKNPAGLNK